MHVGVSRYAGQLTKSSSRCLPDHPSALRRGILRPIPRSIRPPAVSMEPMLQDLLHFVLHLHRGHHALGIPSVPREGVGLENGGCGYGRIPGCVTFRHDDGGAAGKMGFRDGKRTRLVSPVTKLTWHRRSGSGSSRKFSSPSASCRSCYCSDRLRYPPSSTRFTCWPSGPTAPAIS